jgi:glycosyltransferase involved in cell wall biosynthesis
MRGERDLPLPLARLAELRGAAPRPVHLSLVAPVYNEVLNLERLHERVREVFEERDDWELVLVDDGSTDGSADLIRRLSDEDPRVRGVFFEQNCGQTAAMAAGVHLAFGELVATLDADMQNDPGDLPGMLEQLPGHDAVVGWRMGRKDTLVRRLSSRIANWMRNTLSKDSIRDTGCSLKVFRAEAIRSVALFEGMHRFLPTLLRYHGYSVVEHGVSHHPRVAGKSKYGVRNRALRAFKDLLAVRWMHRRLLRFRIAEVGRGRPLERQTLRPAGSEAHPTPRGDADGPRRSGGGGPRPLERT